MESSEIALPPSPRRNLVITRAGKHSLHPGWVCGAEPDFDLLVTTYADDAPTAKDEIRMSVPGPKIAGYSEVFRRCPEIFERYEYIALIDNDIESDARSINECFASGRQNTLLLWQPSLTIDSYFTYAMVLQNPLFEIRFTDYVEMMCPFFKAVALKNAQPLFGLGFETAIDLAWASDDMILNRQVAVLDTVSVRHTRPVGLMKADQGFNPDEGYDVEINRFLASIGKSSFSYPHVLEGVLRGGRRLRFRSVIIAAHAPVARGLWRSPETSFHIVRSLYHLAGFGMGSTFNTYPAWSDKRQ